MCALAANGGLPAHRFPSQTSIMAVAYKGGVVIGADSRTTSGSYIVSEPRVERRAERVHLLTRCSSRRIE